MDYHYVCTREFGKYKIGNMITDPDEWAKVVENGHEHSFVRMTIPAEPPPEPEPEAKPSKKTILT